MFIITLLASAVSLAMVIPLRHYLHPLEIFIYWAFIASFEQLLFTIVTLNLNDVQYDGRLSVFWSLKQATLIEIPILILWCLAWMVRARSAALKAMIFVSSTGVFLIGAHLYLKMGYFVYVRWSHALTVLLYVGLTLLTVMFMIGVRFLMKREKVSR